MEPNARGIVGSCLTVLLLLLLCSAPPLALAQNGQSCSTNFITTTVGCPADCNTKSATGVLAGYDGTSSYLVGTAQPGITTAPGCCTACANADPSACVVWSFYYGTPTSVSNPETHSGTCYFLTDQDCIQVKQQLTSGQSGKGSCPTVKKDPHCNVGGIAFDFHGIAGFWYAFFTDAGLQINAKLVGPTIDCPEQKTWLEQIAVVWIDEAGNKRSLAVKIDQEADWYEQDVLRFESDGQSVEAPVPVIDDMSTTAEDPEVAWLAADGSASILRVPNQRNTSLLSIPDIIELHISTAVDEWIQGSADPLGAYGKYLDMTIVNVRPTSPSVHGIIGQMLQPNAYETKMAIQTSSGENRERVEGNDDMYQVAGLTDTRCHFCRFDANTL